MKLTKSKKKVHSSNPILNQKSLVRKAPGEAVATKGPEAAREALWLPPLQTHIVPTDGSQFITVRIRILCGETEQDLNVKFPFGPLKSSEICDAVANKEGLSLESRQLFTLWIVAKDLELQLRPDIDVPSFIKQWTTTLMEFTHFPETQDIGHPINRHWFVYRREASVSKAMEAKCTDEKILNFFYGEAKRNVILGRYVCSIDEAIFLGGLMLHLIIGPYNPHRMKEGYLSNDNNFRQVIPYRMHSAMKASDWEHKLVQEHSKYSHKTESEVRQKYLNQVRTLPCYGASFFPACQTRPPGCMFEYRTQKWFIAVSPVGIMVIDSSSNRYEFAKEWDNVNVRFSSDRVILRTVNPAQPGKILKFKLFTPQARLVQNLSMRCKYMAAKAQSQSSRS